MGDANGKHQAERLRAFWLNVWERRLGLGVILGLVVFWCWPKPKPRPMPDTGEPRPPKEALLDRRSLRRTDRVRTGAR